MEDDKKQIKACRIVVRGVVHGVGFRLSAKEYADGLKLCGYVRNIRDGNVECVIEGPSKSLKKFIAWSHHGPSGAIVRDLEIEHVEAINFSNFNILYD